MFWVTTSDSCTVIDTSVGYIPSGNEDRGAFHMNGGVYRGTATSGQGTFLRFNGNSTPGSAAQMRQSLRFWGVMVLGRFGGRVSGNYSVLLDNTTSGNFGGLGFFNPLAIAISQGTKITNSLQAFYLSTQLGGSTTIGATEVQDLFASGSTSPRVFNINSSTGGTVQSINDWDLGAIDALTQGSASLISGNTNSSTMNWNKNYKLDFTNTDGSAITDINGQVRIHDTTDTVTSAGTIDTVLGDCPVQLLRKYTHTLGGARPNFQDSNVTEETPYTWAALFRNSSLVVGQTELLGPVGGIELSFPIVTDINILETDTSLVDAYTEFLNSRDVYDYQYKFKEDNMEMPTLQTMPFTISGDTITPTVGSNAIIFSSSQSGVPLQYNGSTAWTLTTPATGFLGGVSTTGTVTVDTTIKGDISAGTISHSFSDGDVIMDGDITCSGSILLNSGTYELIDADYGGMIFNTPAGSTVTLISIGGTGSPTLNTGVTLTKQVEFIVELDGDTYTAADTTLAAFEYDTDGILVGTELTQTSLTPDNDNNQFAVTYSVDPANVVRFAVLVDGYKVARQESDAQAIITLEKYNANIMNKDAVSDNTTVQTSVDALIDGMTVTWDATNARVDYQFANDDALTAEITDAETRNFIYILCKQNVYLSRVAMEDIDVLAVDFNIDGILVGITPEVHYSKVSGGTSAIEPNSQVVDPGNNDQSAALTNAPDDEKVRFNKKATVVFNTNANLEAAAAELKRVYNDDVKPRQNNMALGIPIS